MWVLFYLFTIILEIESKWTSQWKPRAWLDQLRIKRTRQSKNRFFYCIFRKYYLFWMKCRLVYIKICKIVDLAAKKVKRQPIASPLPRNFKRVFLKSFFLLSRIFRSYLCATKNPRLFNFFMKISNFYRLYQRFDAKRHMFYTSCNFSTRSEPAFNR